MKKQLLFLFAILSFITLNAQTYSYTQRIFGGEAQTRSVYLTFVTPTEVLMSISTPNNYMIPAGVGTYSASSGKITFSGARAGNNKLSHFKDEYNDPQDIVIKFAKTANGATAKMLKGYGEFFFGTDESVNLIKENYNITPSSKLVGTEWTANIDDENVTLKFINKYEAILNGYEKVLYTLYGNSIGVVIGNKITKRALVGRYEGSDVMTLQNAGSERTYDSYFDFYKQ